MSEQYDRSTPTPRDQEWVITGLKYYPPPTDAGRYVSRALPLLPMLAEPRRRSSSSSLYNLEEDHASQHTPQHLLETGDENDGRKSTAFSGALDENALAMVQPPQISIPNNPQSDDHPHVVSPQPQRPDSKLLFMWANGDDLVSPIDTPGTASWKNHVVSPLSERFGRGTSSEAGPTSTEYESWFDDTSSDEEERPDSSVPAREKIQLADVFFSGASDSQLPKTNFRYSDPGSPLSPGFDIDGFGEPGPDVGRSQYFDNASGRRTVQPQVHYYSGGEQNHPQESRVYGREPRISFAVPKIDSFSSDRPRAGQRSVPPPLKLGERSVQEERVKTPFSPRPDSTSSERRESNTGEPSTGPQKRRSGLSRFGSLRRSSRQNSPKPPPGFTEILSQLDKNGVVSSTPRAKGILSKAKQGLGIGSDEFKKEKR
ncbi:hypothetical protein F5Y12DRAFT_723752 [Xylaria sp. FL1777]|nr:hypothetical protein F5Y12DRAFT_723752 [Xylaria sp. FL1777]